MAQLEEKLNLIYQHVNDMIKFAEAKNAGLIAFNGAVIIGSISLIKDIADKISENLYLYSFLYLIFVLLMNIISLFIALTSLTAYLRHKELSVEFCESDNLHFFGTIANYTPQLYLEEFKKKYKLKSENQAYEFDMARQIIIVSQIAKQKFKLFNKALIWTFAGLVTPIGLLIYWYVFNPNITNKDKKIKDKKDK